MTQALTLSATGSMLSKVSTRYAVCGITGLRRRVLTGSPQGNRPLQGRHQRQYEDILEQWKRLVGGVRTLRRLHKATQRPPPDPKIVTNAPLLDRLPGSGLQSLRSFSESLNRFRSRWSLSGTSFHRIVEGTGTFSALTVGKSQVAWLITSPSLACADAAELAIRSITLQSRPKFQSLLLSDLATPMLTHAFAWGNAWNGRLLGATCRRFRAIWIGNFEKVR